MIPYENRKMSIEPDNQEISISKQCELLQISRSGFYYKNKEESPENIEIMNKIDKLHSMDPTLGSRRLCVLLNELGFNIARGKTRRLMRKMRIKTVYCVPKSTNIDKTAYKYPYLLRHLKITHPGHVWATDITYIPMEKGFMYMTAIIDLHSRYIVGWDLSNSMEAEWVVSVVQDAIAQHGKPEIINSDQGSQYTSELYTKYLTDSNIAISMDGKGRAIDNVFIERFWRTLKHEKIYLCPTNDPNQLFNDIKNFINYYNNQRKHTSLSNVTPGEVFRRAA
jgi:putative transposase